MYAHNGVIVIAVIYFGKSRSFTYDHRTLKTRLPVRSAIYKQCTGGSVVAWVTSSESPLLYVFAILFAVWVLRVDLLAVVAHRRMDSVTVRVGFGRAVGGTR